MTQTPVTLSSLVERLRVDGVEAGRAEAEALLAAARQEAARLLEEAQAQAEAILQEARTQAEARRRRDEAALAQAARDILLLTRERLHALLEGVAGMELRQAMSPELLARLLEHLAEACARQPRDIRLEALLSPADREALTDYLLDKFRTHCLGGVHLATEEGMFHGFHLRSREGKVSLDFTAPALASAMAELVDPRLAALLDAAAKEQ